MKLYAIAVAATTAALFLGACGDEAPLGGTTPIPGADSGSPPQDSGARRDSSLPPLDSGAPPPADAGDGGVPGQGRSLSKGELEIVGALLDGTIVFLRYDAKISLEAIAPTGGAPTVIAPDLTIEGADTDDVVSVIGGAVGLWTGVNATTELGKLSVWTRANGLKEAAPSSPIYELDASADGARVAFVRGSGATRQLVASPSTLAAAGVVVVQNTLGDGSAANPCPAFYTFVGQDLFSSTCSGSGITATARRTNAAGVSLEIDTGLAPSFLSIDKAGSKVLSAKRITAGGTGGAAAVYTVGAAAVTQVAIEAAGVEDGHIAPDGSQVVYQTRLGALKKAGTTAPVNATELAPNGGLMGILSVAPDFKTVLSHKLAPGGADGSLHDLQLSPVAAAAAPTTLVATATALDFGFTRGGKFALWVPSPAAPVLKARAAAGGADVDLGAVAVVLDTLEGGDDLIVGYNSREITVDGQKVPVVDYKLVSPSGAPSKPLVAAVDVGALVLPGGKLLAFTEPSKGLFVRDVP